MREQRGRKEGRPGAQTTGTKTLLAHASAHPGEARGGEAGAGATRTLLADLEEEERETSQDRRRVFRALLAHASAHPGEEGGGKAGAGATKSCQYTLLADLEGEERETPQDRRRVFRALVAHHAPYDL